MKKGIIYVSVSFLLCFYSLSTCVYAGNMSLKKIKNDIRIYEENLGQVQLEWQEYKNKYGAIGEFFFDNLNAFQQAELSKSFGVFKDRSDAKLFIISKEEDDNVRKQLVQDFLQYQEDFFRSLLVYIPVQKKQDYLNYINSQLEYSQKSVDIKYKISKAEKQRIEKKQKLIEKAAANQKMLEEKIYETAKIKIREKIETIKNSPDFVNMNMTQKHDIFENLVHHIRIQKVQIIDRGEDIEQSQKYKIYSIMEEEFLVTLMDYN